MKYNLKQIASFCKSNMILISRIAYIKEGNRVYILNKNLLHDVNIHVQ